MKDEQHHLAGNVLAGEHEADMADYSYDAGRIAPVSGHFQHGGQRYDGERAADYGAQDYGAAAQVRTVSMTNLLGAAASLALVVGVGIWGYGVMARDVSGVPVVRAASGPMRVAPEDPGGTLADHQGLAVNAVAGQGSAEGPAQQLVLAPRPAGLASEDVATGALSLALQQDAEAMATAAEDGATPAVLSTQSGDNAENDPILALAAQIAAESEPLTPLAPGADNPVVTEVQDVSSSGARDLFPEDEYEEEAEMPKPGPGLGRSLRPRLRPSGLQVASVGPVDADVIAAAVASVTKEIDPATLPAGTRLVQIGAFDSAETARSEWTRLETRFGDFMDGKGRVIQQATSGGRTFYRLRAEGFVDLSDARRFCAAFVAEKVDCIPVVTR
ncbi:SPOR domain-containing protein [Sagittula stellata]|uniref:SPOR domain-containing protein n=1 Tax=Sagittula stellata (strain ATCC 700073 / DSM 11524 / E-37) TaxID=388399 RepID=A3K1W0_SAGS3|nr:SPOR domain-containing protein [Sagittula stellata]EBA08906.1 hypothetical protein SSE37_04650 [Sagittula stellata E-37]